MKFRGLLQILGLVLLSLSAWCGAPAAHAAEQGVTDADIAALSNPPAANDKNAVHVPDAPSMPRLLGQMMLGLGVVFVLMTGVLWVARRYLPTGAGKSVKGKGIEILSTRLIGQRRSLMLVRAGDKTVLLGVTPQSIQMLTEMEPEIFNTTSENFPDSSNEPQWRVAARVAGLPEHAAPGSHGGPAGGSHGTTSLERD